MSHFNQGIVMAKKQTEVILTQPVISLNAHEGDQVKVSPGYARNFLLPQGKAIPASAGNQRYIDALKASRAEREAAELDHMKDLHESLKSLRLHIKAKTGELNRAEDVEHLSPGDRIWIKEGPKRDYWEIFTQAMAVVGNIATVVLIFVSLTR